MKKNHLLLVFIISLLFSMNCDASVGKLVKISARYADDAAKLATKIPGAEKVFQKYGDDAFHVLKNFGDDGLKVINRYGDDAIRFSKNFGDNGVKILNRYGDEAIKISQKYGDDGLKALINYGDEAITLTKNFGDDALKLLNKNSTVCKALVKVKAPAKIISRVAGFSDEGIKITGVILKKLENASAKSYSEFFKFIEKFGEKGSRFIWKNLDNALSVVEKHKVAFVIVSIIVYGFRNPDQVLAGMVMANDQVHHVINTAGSVTSDIGNKAVEKTQEFFSDSYILQIALAAGALLIVLGVLTKFKMIPDLSFLKKNPKNQNQLFSDKDEPNQPESEKSNQTPPWA